MQTTLLATTVGTMCLIGYYWSPSASCLVFLVVFLINANTLCEIKVHKHLSVLTMPGHLKEVTKSNECWDIAQKVN